MDRLNREYDEERSKQDDGNPLEGKIKQLKKQLAEKCAVTAGLAFPSPISVHQEERHSELRQQFKPFRIRTLAAYSRILFWLFYRFWILESTTVEGFVVRFILSGTGST